MSKVNVLITVDTEHSIGGAFRNPLLKPVGNNRRIYCKTSKGDFGIPLIMSIARNYGLTLTFFLEIMNKYFFGESESREICELILSKGHDVQLHLHPNYLNFGTDYSFGLKYNDNMHAYTLRKQIDLLSESKKTLESYGAPSPVAFRAGNYGANLNTLSALHHCGFSFDSSYNLAFSNTACKLCHTEINDVQLIKNVYELPVTNFVECTGKKCRYRPLDLNGVSFRQMKNVLNHAVHEGMRFVTIVLHSFSFVRPLDVQYSKIYLYRMVINRFKKLCRFLSENSDRFDVLTFNRIHQIDYSESEEKIQPMFYKSNIMPNLERYYEQLFDRVFHFKPISLI